MPLLLPTKYISGANTLAEGRGMVMLEELDMEEILHTPHGTDSHMALYSPDSSGKAYNVRYRKRSGAADYLVTCWLAFDYDLPGHRAWESSSEVADTLAKVKADCPDWYAVYTTLHGLRMILKLKDSFQVRRVEALHKQLLSVFTIKYDPQCSDWTRLFRLPYVVRDGVALWEEPLTELEISGTVFDCEVPIVGAEKASPITISRTAPGEEAKNLVWLRPD